MRAVGARVMGLGRGDVTSDEALDGWIRARLSPFGPGHATCGTSAGAVMAGRRISELFDGPVAEPRSRRKVHSASE